jgi:K+-transporting ATPase ATPase C chain
MKNLQLRPLFVVFVTLTLIVGIAYPLVVTKIGQVFFPVQANGSLIVDADGVVRGSRLIAQKFTSPQYFQSSGASNISRASRAFVDARQIREQSWIQRGGAAPVPEALLTTSASGLDPHLSPEAVFYQAPMVAKARNLDLPTLNALISKYIEKPVLGFIGEPRVNIVVLNMALDKL